MKISQVKLFLETSMEIVIANRQSISSTEVMLLAVWCGLYLIPVGWPHVSSSFGSIHLAGFAKASAYWYRSWWLYNAMKNHSTGGIDVPINPPILVNPSSAPQEDNAIDGYLVHIVENWESNDHANSCIIHVYTNAPMVELFINDKSQGVQQLVWQGWAEWNFTYTPGNLTALHCGNSYYYH